MGAHHVHYDSLYDAVRQGRDAPQQWSDKDYNLASRAGERSGTAGNGTPNWEQAERLALYGWEEGVKKLVDLREELMEEIGRALPEPRVMMDVSGFDVDVGAYLSGVPENMLTHWEMEGSKRVVHIVYNMAVNYTITPEAMMLRGLLVAGLVDTMEHLGHRVRLDVVALINGSTYSEGENVLTLTYNLKRENEVLDVERMVFACAHPSMFRRIGFANMEMLPRDKAKAFGVPRGGYGYACSDRSVLPEGERGDIFIGTTERPGSLADVMQQVLDHLRTSDILEEERT